jgi:hypothetical protein
MIKKKLIIFDCEDKIDKNRERWTPARDWDNFPAPYRCILCGPPNSGKSSVIKNLLIDAKPGFDVILLLHFSQTTKEYEKMDCDILDGMPDPESFIEDDGLKKLLIIEDIEYSHMSKDDLQKLDRLYGYTSSHCNLSIYLTSQEFNKIPVCARRNSNVFIIFKSNDHDYLWRMAMKCGLRKNDFDHIFINLCNARHDALWIDFTINTPAPLRKNGFERIMRLK